MSKKNVRSIGAVSALAAALSSFLWAAGPAHAENIQHLQQLMNTRECQGCDLSRTGLVHGSLSGVDLSGADLSGANLSRADLRNADLSGANLSGAVLVNADLTGANLSNANLTGADLREVYFTGATLTGAVLENALLLGAIGLPDTVLTAETLYLWGMAESRRGNYGGAIDYYTRAYEAKPDFPNAVLARAIARYRMGDADGAITDATLAQQMYLTTNNQHGQEVSQQLVMLATAYKQAGEVEISAGQPNFLDFITSLSGMALQFLMRGGLF